MMRHWRLSVPIVWMAVIWLLSSLPATQRGQIMVQIPEVVQNGAHAVVYGILAAAWTFALGSRVPQRILLLCLGYGIVDELHQLFVPGRTASVADVLVDVIGAATVLYVIHRSLQDGRRLPAHTS